MTNKQSVMGVGEEGVWDPVRWEAVPNPVETQWSRKVGPGPESTSRDGQSSTGCLGVGWDLEKLRAGGPRMGFHGLAQP